MGVSKVFVKSQKLLEEFQPLHVVQKDGKCHSEKALISANTFIPPPPTLLTFSLIIFCRISSASKGPNLSIGQQIAQDSAHFESFCTSKQRRCGCSTTNPHYTNLHWLFIGFYIDSCIGHYTRGTNENNHYIDANY